MHVIVWIKYIVLVILGDHPEGGGDMCWEWAAGVCFWLFGESASACACVCVSCGQRGLRDVLVECTGVEEGARGIGCVCEHAGGGYCLSHSYALQN